MMTCEYFAFTGHLFLLTIFSTVLSRPVPSLDLCKNLALPLIQSSQHLLCARHYSGFWGYGAKQDRKVLISRSLHFSAPINSFIYPIFDVLAFISFPLVYLPMNFVKCIWHIPFWFLRFLSSPFSLRAYLFFKARIWS